MNTFTAQDMKDYGDYVATLDSAMLSPNFEKWCRERFEPAKKVIDLSVLIESGIDCEFKDDFSSHITIGTLLRITDCPSYPYETDNSKDEVHEECQPRMNHIHAWKSGACPIEGFVVRAWFDTEDFTTVDTSSNIINWSKVMYVQFLEVEDGYVMPYDKESE
tara:strand:+ start:1031 stop:1516 length:486 start_codon:yes stop_codon:yes gene_type:complete